MVTIEVECEFARHCKVSSGEHGLGYVEGFEERSEMTGVRLVVEIRDADGKGFPRAVGQDGRFGGEQGAEVGAWVAFLSLKPWRCRVSWRLRLDRRQAEKLRGPANSQPLGAKAAGLSRARRVNRRPVARHGRLVRTVVPFFATCSRGARDRRAADAECGHDIPCATPAR